MANVGPHQKNHAKMLKRQEEREWKQEQKRLRKAETEEFRLKPGWGEPTEASTLEGGDPYGPTSSGRGLTSASTSIVLAVRTGTSTGTSPTPSDARNAERSTSSDTE